MYVQLPLDTQVKQNVCGDSKLSTLCFMSRRTSKPGLSTTVLIPSSDGWSMVSPPHVARARSGVAETFVIAAAEAIQIRTDARRQLLLY